MLTTITGAVIFAAGVLFGAYLVDRLKQGKPLLPEPPKALHKIIPAKRDEYLDE